MMHKVVVMAAVLSAALFGGTSTASAARQPGSCEPHSTMSTPHDLVFDEIIDMSIYPDEIWALIVADIDAVVDKNGDDKVCWRYRTPNPGQDRYWSRVAGRTVEDYVATYVSDNNVQGR